MIYLRYSLPHRFHQDGDELVLPCVKSVLSVGAIRRDIRPRFLGWSADQHHPRPSLEHRSATVVPRCRSGNRQRRSFPSHLLMTVNTSITWFGNIYQRHCIYCRSKGANSELVSLQLFKSYCLPFMLYASEAVPLTKSSVKLSDDCVQRAICKIFKVNDRDNIAVIRHNCNLPYIGTVIEQRRLNFVNKILDISYLACLFVLWFYFSCVVPFVVLHLCFKFYFIFTLLLLCTAFMRIKIYMMTGP